jgi:hypothetical protein
MKSEAKGSIPKGIGPFLSREDVSMPWVILFSSGKRRAAVVKTYLSSEAFN